MKGETYSGTRTKTAFRWSLFRFHLAGRTHTSRKLNLALVGTTAGQWQSCSTDQFYRRVPIAIPGRRSMQLPRQSSFRISESHWQSPLEKIYFEPIRGLLRSGPHKVPVTPRILILALRNSSGLERSRLNRNPELRTRKPASLHIDRSRLSESIFLVPKCHLGH